MTTALGAVHLARHTLAPNTIRSVPLALCLALSACSVVDIDDGLDGIRAEAPVVEAVVVSATPGGNGRALDVQTVVLAPNACFETDGFQFFQEGTRVLIDALVRADPGACADATPRELPLRMSIVARGEGPRTLVFDGVDGTLEVPFEGAE